MEEGKGFEPLGPLSRASRFRNGCDQPDSANLPRRMRDSNPRIPVLAGPPVFKTGAIGHSANPPLLPSLTLLVFLSGLGGLLFVTIWVFFGGVVMVAVNTHRCRALETQPHL